MALVHLIYSSEAATPLSEEQLGDLMKSVRAKNAAAGVSGILLLIERSFFQLLEGDPTVVDPLFEKIKGDARHGHVIKLIREPIEQREFEDWSMGLARVQSKELAALPGFNDFLTAGTGLLDLGSGRARTLLHAFRDGQWRARVSG